MENKINQLIFVKLESLLEEKLESLLEEKLESLLEEKLESLLEEKLESLLEEKLESLLEEKLESLLEEKLESLLEEKQESQLEENASNDNLIKKEFKKLSNDKLQELFKDINFSKNIPEFFPNFPINKFDIPEINSIQYELHETRYTNFYIYKNIKIISNFELNFNIYQKEKYDSIIYYNLDDKFQDLYFESKLFENKLLDTIKINKKQEVRHLITNIWNDNLLKKYKYIVTTRLTGILNENIIPVNIRLTGDILELLEEYFDFKIDEKTYDSLGYTNKNNEDYYTTTYICWN
jgi:hypothetical protein